MTPPFGLMMFWLPEMRMKPLWMSAMRRPRMPQIMLAVSARVTVTLTMLNFVMINLNSLMINVILNFLMQLGMKQWRFLSMYRLMMFLLIIDDEAAKEKAARYEQTKRLFNRGKGARNSVGKVERCTPPIYINCDD